MAAAALRLTLLEHPGGVTVPGGPGVRVVYDIAGDVAHFGRPGSPAVAVAGPALRWEITPAGAEPELLGGTVALANDLAPLDGPLLVRCDRIDFPPGGIAYRHTHPGPGIRRLLFGSIRIETDGHVTDYGPGGPWFESGPSPVLAHASAGEDSAFVRVMVLPAEWEGKRTIRYVDPADAELPKLQRAHVYFDKVIAQ